MEKERRRRKRFPISRTFELATSDGEIVQARGINLSEGGMMCQTDTDIPLGTYVIFQLPVSDEKGAKTVRCEGTVLRSCAAGPGDEGKFHIVIDFND
ncbi:MAG: PilZ domain-containing protein [Spirochaetes bacterium]|nr:PilZ domain-containing protein [Spirochaetota bacterium]